MPDSIGTGSRKSTTGTKSLESTASLQLDSLEDDSPDSFLTSEYILVKHARAAPKADCIDLYLVAYHQLHTPSVIVALPL